MPSSLNRRIVSPASRHTIKAESGKAMKDTPIATEMHISGIQFSNIWLTVGNMSFSLKAMDTKMVTELCKNANNAENAALLAEDAPLRVQLQMCKAWTTIVAPIFVYLFEKHGYAGGCVLEQKELILLRPGDQINPINNNERLSGSFASVLIDLPFSYSGAIICAFQDNRIETFDFLVNSVDTISALCWFHGSNIMIEPIKSGFRAFILYEAVINQDTAPPLTFTPNCARMHNLEVILHKLGDYNEELQQVDLKTAFLPLVRILIHPYKCAGNQVPGPLHWLLFNRLTRVIAEMGTVLDDPEKWFCLFGQMKELVELLEYCWTKSCQ